MGNNYKECVFKALSAVIRLKIVTMPLGMVDLKSDFSIWWYGKMEVQHFISLIEAGRSMFL